MRSHLHDEAAHRTGGAEHEHPLPGLHPGVRAHGQQGGARGDREGRRLLVGHAVRDGREALDPRRGILGESALAGAEDPVADRQAGDPRAEGHDLPGHLPAEDRLTGSAQAEGRPGDVGSAGEQVQDAPVEAGRTHREQHLAGTGLGAGHGLHLHLLDTPVGLAGDRAHGLGYRGYRRYRRRRAVIAGVGGVVGHRNGS